MSRNVKPSLFASTLRRLLDETGVFTRSEWAEFLHVTESAISQWVCDNTLPRAEHLRKIMWVLRTADDVPARIIAAFDQMAAMPADEVSPHRKNLGSTVGDYMINPLLDAFLRDLRRLDPPAREKFLLEAAAKCAEESGMLTTADRMPAVLSIGAAGSAVFN